MAWIGFRHAHVIEERLISDADFGRIASCRISAVRRLHLAAQVTQLPLAGHSALACAYGATAGLHQLFPGPAHC